MRKDKRKLDQIRKIKVQRNFIKYAEGSCFIEAGNTKVICTASLEKNIPHFLKGSGSGWVTAEYRMLPRSTQMRNLRDRTSSRSYEIQRLIGRALRSVVNLKELGEKTIWIDCDVVCADGGTRTTSIVGGFIALVDCLNKIFKEGVIKTLPVNNFLGATSVGVWHNQYILDLTYEEDVEADVDMNIVMTGKGEFVEIQGTAEGKTFSRKDLDILLSLAEKGIEEIIDWERNLFKDILTF